MYKPKFGNLEQVNKELWILLSLFAICLLLNRVVDGQRMVLSFYTLPTLGSAYLYGRRQATLTALGSVLLVCLTSWYNPGRPGRDKHGAGAGGPLDRRDGRGEACCIVTGYSMGSLVRASTGATRGDPRDVSRRAHDPQALHREGRVHRESQLSRVGLRREHRREPGTVPGPASRIPARRPCFTISANWISAASCCTRPRVSRAPSTTRCSST